MEDRRTGGRQGFIHGLIRHNLYRLVLLYPSGAPVLHV